MTSSRPSSSDDSSFDLLHPSIQRWVWSKGWTSLRDAQERAIKPILEGQRDLIIAAATAAGKTEAAFLPILTRIANAGEESALAIYTSPLKALINDQWGRLEQLCESLEIPVIPWHGDISQSRKQRFLRHPRGVLLITPESLEAIFVRRGSEAPRLFAEVMYVVVDELHAFIGTERGKQMQSLLHRMEHAATKRIPRIGLSATLGDMNLAAAYLRPGSPSSVDLIVSKAGNQDLRVQVRGYLSPAVIEDPENDSEGEDRLLGAEYAIADHLYNVLRGSNNLVFPNSRKKVEFYTDALRRKCESDSVPVEFWPHHGCLSRSIREETEKALKAGDRPATAVCTTTLELGIDIGAVKTVAQIGPGPSVASIRQRLGRSGRRPGEPAILRSYNIEQSLTDRSSFSDRLRESLVQSIAMIRLLLRGWYEPPNAAGLHLSTLVQQILSVIAERGGAHAGPLYRLFVLEGPFGGLTQPEFGELLRGLGLKDLITQDRTGLLLLGQTGEQLVGSHDFYAAFTSEDEWQIVCQGQTIGTLPISSPIFVGMRLIFAGRRWLATSVEDEALIVCVVADPGGMPPSFGGSRASTHDVVRSEMRSVLATADQVGFLDQTANALLAEARRQYADLNLSSEIVLRSGEAISLFTWRGDPTNDALVLILRGLGIERVENEGIYLIVEKYGIDRLHDALTDIAELTDVDYMRLLTDVFNMRRSKWDWALPDSLLKQSFASLHLSFSGARTAARELVSGTRR
ncbi:DEAD/DEAH box helicase [Peristeroidobacter agariperforans]|uniref:DEAD/DEAH box helicase n=1 Tax=Peristeroidobacter agariperforans TaxID=268404 RepID=UPI00101CE113|nr:DEAD/DEAH box helicase [Peristeroidobacter agariperforans]